MQVIHPLSLTGQARRFTRATPLHLVLAGNRFDEYEQFCRLLRLQDKS